MGSHMEDGAVTPFTLSEDQKLVLVRERLN